MDMTPLIIGSIICNTRGNVIIREGFIELFILYVKSWTIPVDNTNQTGVNRMEPALESVTGLCTVSDQYTVVK